MSRLLYRRGALGLLITVACLAVMFVLPAGIALIGFLDSQLLVYRTAAFIDETLPQAYLCLDMEALAAGELLIDAASVDSFIRARIDLNLPSALHGRIQIEQVTLDWRPVSIDPDHWLGDDQPASLPVVSCTVTVEPVIGPPTSLTRSVELFQMPE